MSSEHAAGAQRRPPDRDDLFSPTVRAAPTGPSPWRVPSQFWVFFFGGVLAGAVIAYANGARLGLGAGYRRLVVAWGALGLLAAVIVAALIPDDASDSSVRLASRVAAVLAYFPIARLQRPAERSFELRGGDHASLWAPGLVAVLVGGLVQGILTAAARGLA